MTTTANHLRAALKEAGFNARRATVKGHHSALYVTIRDASVSLTKVKAIAAPFERVHRCEVSGEILAGGNVFLSCAYSEALIAPIKAAIAKVLDAAPSDEMVTVIGDFRAAKVSRERGATYPDEVQIHGPSFDHRNRMACGAHWAAERIAVAYLDTRALASDGAQDSAAVMTR
jgi:hypothetical protein